MVQVNKKFFRLPKNQVIIAFSLLFLIAAPRQGILESLVLLILTLGSTVAADYLFTYLKTRKWIFSQSAVITGLILTLIIDPSASWWQILGIAAAAMALKVFLRPGKQHIFNPAATGLLFGFILFGLYPAWWAPSPYDPGQFTILNLLVYIPIFLILYTSGYRMRRARAIATYLLVYFLASYLITPPASLGTAIATLLSQGTLFYAFAMLVEPVTSPSNKMRQIFYGAFVAVTSVILVWVSLNANTTLIFDASLIALLLGNLVFFKFK